MSKRLTRAVKAAGLSTLAIAVTAGGFGAKHSVAQAARTGAFSRAFRRQVAGVETVLLLEQLEAERRSKNHR